MRWGHANCPETEGTRLLYTGRAAGSPHYQQGGMSDYLCLPNQPEYPETDYRRHAHHQHSFVDQRSSMDQPDADSFVDQRSSVAGAVYMTFEGEPLGISRGGIIPCAICHTSPRSALLVIPARLSCPDSWTREYSGYLLSSSGQVGESSTVCVDVESESVYDNRDHVVGRARLCHMEAEDHGLECPPFNPEMELTCAVCTK